MVTLHSNLQEGKFPKSSPAACLCHLQNVYNIVYDSQEHEFYLRASLLQFHLHSNMNVLNLYCISSKSPQLKLVHFDNLYIVL